MKFLIHFIFKVVFYVIVFVALVWALLDISPRETMDRSIAGIAGWGQTVSSFFGHTAKTAGDMKGVAQSQLRQASDRFDGKDPYENAAKKFDADVQQGQ